MKVFLLDQVVSVLSSFFTFAVSEIIEKNNPEFRQKLKHGFFSRWVYLLLGEAPVVKPFHNKNGHNLPPRKF